MDHQGNGGSGAQTDELSVIVSSKGVAGSLSEAEAAGVTGGSGAEAEEEAAPDKEPVLDFDTMATILATAELDGVVEPPVELDSNSHAPAPAFDGTILDQLDEFLHRDDYTCSREISPSERRIMQFLGDEPLTDITSDIPPADAVQNVNEDELSEERTIVPPANVVLPLNQNELREVQEIVIPTDAMLLLNQNEVREVQEIVPRADTMPNLNGNGLSEEQVIVPPADSVQPLNQNEAREVQEIVPPTDAVPPLNENEIRVEHEIVSPSDNVQDEGSEVERVRTSQPNPNNDTLHGASIPQGGDNANQPAIRFKLLVPEAYQGNSALENSQIHGFATANQLREAISTNQGWVTENQVMGLLQNTDIFQLEENEEPDIVDIRKGAVIVVSENRRAVFPITREYTSTRRILKEHGPTKLKISGVTVNKFVVKGNIWSRRRYQHIPCVRMACKTCGK